MRVILTAILVFLALGATSLPPASADSAIAAVRAANQQPNGRFPAMSRVNCVVPYCFHNPDGSLDWRRSTEALEEAQNYGERRSGDVSAR